MLNPHNSGTPRAKNPQKFQWLTRGRRIAIRFLSDHLYKSSAVAEMGDRGHNRHGPKRRGAAVPISRGAGSPSNTMWPGPRSTSVPGGVFIHPAVWPQYTWPKIGWGAVPFFWGRSWIPIEQKVAWAEAYLRTKWHLSPSSRLATTDIGRKLERAVPL